MLMPFTNQYLMSFSQDTIERSEKERTLVDGRFTHSKYIFGISAGKWYCSYTNSALREIGSINKLSSF